MKSDTWC